ncbi:MAG: hypothetical protein E5W28_01255 [Mesorhizobium sp.]|nr:MAG: hypothetical protein EOS63_01350 [Mesorhizobium sp.]TIT06864.1 MAG: hypothetical protein E5W74_28185 [Mesorhizobium sp.]TIU42337.1 MAG: hypothetical protein E5W28_01255 [Mesorhizobium sp.]TJW58344.1 MAG: hypothetical protein E5V97_32910 [Mesorhizobium sp.]
MITDPACAALREGRVLEIRYDGYFRAVEVHAVGFTKDGNAVMRVWQVRGGSASNERVGWKLLRFDEAVNFGLLEEPSQAPRQGYNRNDPIMTQFVCRL